MKCDCKTTWKGEFKHSPKCAKRKVEYWMQGLTQKKLPSLNEIDRRDKLELWLAMEVLEQGVWDISEFYETLESHFALVSGWRELKITLPDSKLPEDYKPTNTRKIWRW